MEANNTKAMREALENFTRYEESDICQLEYIAKKMIDRCEYGGGIIQAIAGSIRDAKSAIVEPPRNCDVGTAEEQEVRFRNYCWNHSSKDKNMECQCPIDAEGKAGCKLTWAQMPYEEGENDGEVS